MIRRVVKYVLAAAVCFAAVAGNTGTAAEGAAAEAELSLRAESVTNVYAESPTGALSSAAASSENSDKPLKSWRSAAGDSVKHGGLVAVKLLLFVAVLFVCLIALALSVLSFSGAWLILAAALVCMILVNTPGWGTFAVFLVVSIAGEIVEAVSSFSGVKKRGGSSLAGLAGFVGAIVGGIAGAAVIPVVGALAGMLAGTFGGVFAVEWYRLRHSGDASYIAWGAFYSRIIVLFVKLGSAVIMSGWLLWRLARDLMS